MSLAEIRVQDGLFSLAFTMRDGQDLGAIGR